MTSQVSSQHSEERHRASLNKRSAIIHTCVMRKVRKEGPNIKAHAGLIMWSPVIFTCAINYVSLHICNHVKNFILVWMCFWVRVFVYMCVPPSFNIFHPFPRLLSSSCWLSFRPGFLSWHTLHFEQSNKLKWLFSSKHDLTLQENCHTIQSEDMITPERKTNTMEFIDMYCKYFVLIPTDVSMLTSELSHTDKA